MGMLLTLLLFCWLVLLIVTAALWTAGGVILAIRAAAQLGRRTRWLIR